MEQLTETIFVKYIFNDKEILEYSRKMAHAESTISEKADALKSMTTTIKADIAIQEEIMHGCAEKIRSGYEMRPKECGLRYEKGIVAYVDKETGEIVETRPMTETEQLKLSGKWVDAEKVIWDDTNKDEEKPDKENKKKK